MPDTTLDIVIRMLADGDGAKVSKQQLEELIALEAKMAAQIEKAGGKDQVTPFHARQLENTRNIIGALQQSNAGKQLGAKMAEEVADEFGAAMPARLKMHLATILGRLPAQLGLGREFNLTGIGSAVGSGGLAGIGLAGGIAGLEIAVQQIHKVVEEMRAAEEVGQKLKQTLQYSPEAANSIHEIADRISDAKTSTKDWLEQFAHLISEGLKTEAFPDAAQHIKQLAGLMGGDAKAATAAFTGELRGNFQALRAVGIVIDENITHEEQLAQATHAVALRTAALGNAAVSAAPKIRELKDAGESAAEGLTAIKREANAANAALATLLKTLEETNKSRHGHADDTAGQKTAEVEKEFAAGKLNAAQRDEKIEAIQKEQRDAKFNSDKNTLTAQKALHDERAQQARKEIEDRRAEGDAASEQFKRSQEWEDKAAKATDMRAVANASRGTSSVKLQKGQVYPWGDDDPDFPEKQAKAAEAAAQRAKEKAFGITSSEAAEKLNTIYGADGSKMREANDKAREVITKNNQESSRAEAQMRDLEDHHAHEEATKHIEAQTKRIELRKQLQKKFEDWQRSAAQGQAHGKNVPMPEELKGFMGPDGRFHPPDLFPEPAAPKPKPRPRVFEYPPGFAPGESEPVPKNQQWNEETRRRRRPQSLPPAANQQEQVERDEAAAAAASNRARWAEEDAKSKAEQEAERARRQEREDPARARAVQDSPIASSGGVDDSGVASGINASTSAIEGMGAAVIENLNIQNQKIVKLTKTLAQMAGDGRTSLLTSG